MSGLHIQLERIKRRRWLVLFVVAAAVAAAMLFSAIQGTVYTAKATLAVTSEERAPEQDAVLAQGYADYFSQDSSQQALRAAAGVPDDVSFRARTSAASPILYIEADARNAELAATSAGALARTFLEDVNAGMRQGAGFVVADFREQIAAIEARLADPAITSEERLPLTEQRAALEGGINDLLYDTTNQLVNLELDDGVARTSPNVALNGLMALFGGLALGAVAALALAGLANRLDTANDVRERLGVDPLAVVPAVRTARTRRMRAKHLKNLATAVSLSDMNRPAVLAVTAPRSSEVTSQLAGELAAYRAQQGERTLFVHADLDATRRNNDHDGRPGVADFLAGGPGTGLQSMVVPNGPGGILVLPAGNGPADPYALFAPERFVNLVQQAGRLADLVVIDAPPLLDAAEGQVVCAAADRTLMVVEQEVTRIPDAIEARELLRRVDATLLGVVIAEAGPGGESLPPASAAVGRVPVPQHASSASGVTIATSTNERDAGA
ncbi:MAG: CpsD/CapB family tyrosine-protein kinase [Actinomycetota bacterium]|nr:CpsD/CapB family tyrosine-protein kinase [Actinomycetota bacterium]